MSRDRTKLHPEAQKKVEDLIKACEKAGLKIGISECLRTVAEQDALYAKGRTVKGSIVTNAKGSQYESMHQWGIAFDFYRNDGKGAYENKDGFFQKVGKIGQSLGLEWGGSWKSFVDMPHFQLPDWGSTASKLKKQYGTPEKFMKTWIATEKKTVAKNPYSVPTKNVMKGSTGNSVRWVQWELNQTENAGLVVDGDFGAKTDKAVRTFQKKHKLEVDGIVGKNTRAKLSSEK